jgi:hypothetical protein
MPDEQEQAFYQKARVPRMIFFFGLGYLRNRFDLALDAKLNQKLNSIGNQLIRKKPD